MSVGINFDKLVIPGQTHGQSTERLLLEGQIFLKVWYFSTLYEISIAGTLYPPFSVYAENFVLSSSLINTIYLEKKKRNQHCFDVKTWQVHDNKNIVSLTNLEAKILIKYQSIKQWFKEVVTSRIREAVF